MPGRTPPPPLRVTRKAVALPDGLKAAPDVPTPDEYTLVVADSQRSELLRAVEKLESVAHVIEPLAAALRDADQLEALLDLYGRLDDLRRTVQYLVDTTGRAAIVTVPDRFTAYPVPGGGVFKVGGGRERKSYDQPKVIAALAHALEGTLGLAGVVTPEGEVGDPGPVIAEIVQTMAKATGATAPSFTGWRSTVAKELGVSLNEYAETTDTGLTHRIEGRT